MLYCHKRMRVGDEGGKHPHMHMRDADRSEGKESASYVRRMRDRIGKKVRVFMDVCDAERDLAYMMRIRV